VKKRYALFAVPIVFVALLVALAGGASATPSKTSACSGCHDPGTATITVSIGSQTASSITYNVSGSTANGGAQGWGAFTGTTKVGGQYNAGSFTVPKDGKIYSVYWVDKNPSSMAAYATKSVTAPVATTTTTTARATTTTVPASTTTTTARATTTTTVGATTTTTVGATTTTTTSPTTATTVRSTTTTLQSGTTSTTLRHEREHRQRKPTTTTTVDNDDDDDDDHVSSLASATQDDLGVLAHALGRLFHIS